MILRHFDVGISVSPRSYYLDALINVPGMHLIMLISSTVKKDVGCNDLSLHKFELGDNLRVGFPRNNIGI